MRPLNRALHDTSRTTHIQVYLWLFLRCQASSPQHLPTQFDQSCAVLISANNLKYNHKTPHPGLFLSSINSQLSAKFSMIALTINSFENHRSNYPHVAKRTTNPLQDISSTNNQARDSWRKTTITYQLFFDISKKYPHWKKFAVQRSQVVSPYPGEIFSSMTSLT